jgi:cell division septation protein DedD
VSTAKDFKPADTWADGKQHQHHTGMIVIGLIAIAIIAGVLVNLHEIFTPEEQMYNGVLVQPESTESATATASTTQQPSQSPPQPAADDTAEDSQMAFFSFYDELPNRQVSVTDTAGQALRTVHSVKPQLLPTVHAPKPGLNEINLPPPPLPNQPLARSLTPEPPANGRGYIIQAGAFDQFAQADKVRDRLASMGFRAYVEAGKLGNMPVQPKPIGPIADATQAKAIRRQLDNKGIPSITLGPD